MKNIRVVSILAILISFSFLLSGCGGIMGNQKPVAVFTWEQVEPGVIEFDGSGSTDSDGEIATYEWDFGDGSTATGIYPQKLYEPGDYLVTLTVTDDDGATNTVEKTVTVVPEDRLPQPDIQVTHKDWMEPLEYEFDASESTDDGDIVDYLWRFDDGGVENGIKATYTFTEPGTHSITLVLTDNEGLKAEVTTELEIANPNPVPDFYYYPLEPRVNDIVTFHAFPSFDPASLSVASLNPEITSNDMLKYIWEFDHRLVDWGDDEKYGLSVAIRAREAGIFDVTLTVMDNLGNEASITKKVQVKEDYIY